MNAEDLLRRIAADAGASQALRRRLHEAPELAHREELTARAIEAALPVPVERIAGTGLLARVGSGEAPPVVVRAELDALPIHERTGAPFASGNGAMHACGHDVHAAALVALVRAAAPVADRLPAPLVALFQPSEEAYPSGAAVIVEEGLPLPDVCAIVGAHVHHNVAWGSVALDAGPINASSDTVTIRVEGAGAHAAYPHTGRDPILALSAIVLSLQASLSRRLDPLGAALLSIGQIQGGGAENVIPHTAAAKGTLRALAATDRELATAVVEQVVGSTAAAHGCTADLRIERGAPALVNDDGLVDAVRELLPQLGLELAPELRSLGADDLSYFGSIAPLAMAFVGLAGAPGFAPRPLHHPEFLPPEAAVGQVAAVQAALYLGAAQG
jgi:amidohydrolase